MLEQILDPPTRGLWRLAAVSMKRKYRQAEEAGDAVEVLCFACRRSKSSGKQSTMLAFLSAGAAAASSSTSAAASSSSTPLCGRCRRPMLQSARGGAAGAASGAGRVIPHLVKFRSYQRVAAQQGVPFTLTENRASALMRAPCVTCGAAAGADAGACNGLTRLRVWPPSLAPARPARGGFMGPYDDANVKPACAMCNMMKGARRVRSFVEAARTIATHRAGLDFGRFPRRFRDNVSKRSRSSYISQSSTHTKTHSLSNAQFAAIVARPCHYCGKAPRAPRDGDRGHFNGLDRLDSDNRVYAEGTVVACCGDCNMLKYKYAEDAFIAQCVAVATFNVGVDAFPGDVDEEADDDEDEAAALEGEGAAEGRLEDAEETIAAAASEGGDDAAASDPLFAQFAFAGGE